MAHHLLSNIKWPTRRGWAPLPVANTHGMGCPSLPCVATHRRGGGTTWLVAVLPSSKALSALSSSDRNADISFTAPVCLWLPARYHTVFTPASAWAQRESLCLLPSLPLPSTPTPLHLTLLPGCWIALLLGGCPRTSQAATLCLLDDCEHRGNRGAKLREE